MAVVVAAFNAAKYISETLDSVLSQTRIPDEVLVADDGSIDSTWAVISAHPIHGISARTLFERHDNMGQSATQNRLVSQAASDWVVLLDADDIMMPERLASIERTIEQNPTVDIVTTDAYLIDSNGDLTGQRYYGADGVAWYSGPKPDREILRRNFVFGAAAIRRARWVEIGGMRNLKQAQDYLMWSMLLVSGSGVALCPEPLYLYRRHPFAASTSVLENAQCVAVSLSKLNRAIPLMRVDLRLELIRSYWRCSQKIGWAISEVARSTGDPTARSALFRILTGPDSSWRVRVRSLAALGCPRLWRT